MEGPVLPSGFLAESQQGFVLLLTRQDCSRIHTEESKIEPKQSWKGRTVWEQYRLLTWLLMRLVLSLHPSGLRISRGSDARVRELAAGPPGARRRLPAEVWAAARWSRCTTTGKTQES